MLLVKKNIDVHIFVNNTFGVGWGSNIKHIVEIGVIITRKKINRYKHIGRPNWTKSPRIFFENRELRILKCEKSNQRFYQCFFGILEPQLKVLLNYKQNVGTKTKKIPKKWKSNNIGLNQSIKYLTYWLST
jgi:hypothetical protein